MADLNIPIHPPVEWFSPPEGGIPTDRRIVIEASGRAYGYIAMWNTCHAGISGCVKPPKGSPTDYEYAHQGQTLTAEGNLINTAVIGGGAGHAPVNMDNASVPAYYDNTGTQLLRVRYGADDTGLWFAGALWPDASELDVEHIRASSISGDWRWHAAWRQTSGGAYDFAGACFVNIPGYPIPNADGNIGDRAGRMRSLAASMNVDLLGDGEIFVIGNEGNSDASITASMEGGAMDEETRDEIVKCVLEAIDARSVEPVVADGSCGCGKDEAATDEAPAADIVASIPEELGTLVETLAKRVDELESDYLARKVLED